MKHKCNLSIAVVGACLVLLADSVLAQTSATVRTPDRSPDSAQITSDCNKLRDLETKIPGGEAGSLLK